MVFAVKIVALLEQYALKEVLVPVESLDTALKTRNMNQARRWYNTGGPDVVCTGGDNPNKVCFGRNTKFFRESGDFAGNRET